MVALLKVRHDIAAEHGYKSYAEYAYERVYERDYTPEMIQTPFRRSNKRHERLFK